jgi:hypothetical protein
MAKPPTLTTSAQRPWLARSRGDGARRGRPGARQMSPRQPWTEKKGGLANERGQRLAGTWAKKPRVGSNNSLLYVVWADKRATSSGSSSSTQRESGRLGVLNIIPTAIISPRRPARRE